MIQGPFANKKGVRELEEFSSLCEKCYIKKRVFLPKVL